MRVENPAKPNLPFFLSQMRILEYSSKLKVT